MQVNSRKSVSVQVVRMTDKLLQAKMRNRCADDRLLLQLKALDRGKRQAKRTMDSSKQNAIEDLRRMQQVSGLSLLGRAPDGPHDRTHMSSPYFTGCRLLTEKHLVKWRSIEKELLKMLARDAELLIPPWEWQSDQVLGY